MEIAYLPLFNGYESTIISAINTSFTDHHHHHHHHHPNTDEEARLYFKIHINKTTQFINNNNNNTASSSTLVDFSVHFSDVWDPRDGGPSQLKQQLSNMVGQFGGNKRSWSAVKDWVSSGAQDVVGDMMVECICPRDLCVCIQVHFITYVDATHKRGRKRKRFDPDFI